MRYSSRLSTNDPDTVGLPDTTRTLAPPALDIEGAAHMLAVGALLDRVARKGDAREFGHGEEFLLPQGGVDLWKPGIHGRRFEPNLDARASSVAEAKLAAETAKRTPERRACLLELERDAA